MGTDIDFLREYEWDTVPCGEIYIVIGAKGLKLRTQANKKVKLLMEKKEIPVASKRVGSFTHNKQEQCAALDVNRD